MDRCRDVGRMSSGEPTGGAGAEDCSQSNTGFESRASSCIIRVFAPFGRLPFIIMYPQIFSSNPGPPELRRPIELVKVAVVVAPRMCSLDRIQYVREWRKSPAYTYRGDAED